MSIADTFRTHLADLEKKVNAEPDRGGMAVIGIRNSDDQRRNLMIDPGRIEPQLSRDLFVAVDRNVEQPGAGEVPLVLEVGQSRYETKVSVVGIDGPVVLAFNDGSTMPLGRDLVREIAETVNITDQVDVVVVDAETLLSEPFTVDQYASIEGILGWLWDEAASGQLTEGQQAQILAIAHLIKYESIDTVPGETKREVMVRVTQRGLKYLRSDLPKDALNWAKLYALLKAAGWLDTLAQLV